MTKTSIYQAINKYVNSMENISDAEAIFKAVKARQTMTGAVPAVFTLSNLLIALEDDIRAENAKTSGKGNLHKAASRIIKNASSEKMKGAMMQDGKQFVCDGYRLLIIDNPLDLPAPPVPGGEDFKIQPVIGPCRLYDMPLDLPSIPDIKAYITLEKAKRTSKHKKPIYYDMGDGLPAMNAEYLLTMLEADPAFIVTWSGKTTTPIYFKGDGIEGILCPIRKKAAEDTAA